MPLAEPFVPAPEPVAESNGEARAEPPRRRLPLAPWPRSPEAAEAATQAKPAAAWRVNPLAIAASIATLGLVTVGLFAGFDHMRERALLAGKTKQTQELTKTLAELKSHIDALEASRAQEPVAEMRKTLAEIKAAAATALNANGSLGQLSQRVDRMDKDQGARLEKLSEKLEQSSANKYAEIAARLEKLEKRSTTVALAQPSPTPQARPVPSPSPGVSNDITGSIEKPKPVLHGYVIDDVHGGVAYLESRDGPYTVSPGDVLPGAGRVLKIERRGPNWVVVTSQGLIMSPGDVY